MTNLTINRVKEKKAFIVLALVIAVLSVYGLNLAIAANEVTGLSVSPDPIRLGNSASIFYTVNQPCAVAISVLKENGELVKLLLNNVNKNPGSYSISWNGNDESGTRVPDGNYRILVEAKDQATLAVIGQAEITKVAASVPALSNVSHTPDPFNPAEGQQATINYTLSHDANVTVTILKGTTVIRTIASNQLQSAGANSIIWDGKNNAGFLVGDGSYYYQIDAVSPLVLTFKNYVKPTIIVEKEPPQINSFTVSTNPFKISGQSTTLYYTLSENASVTLKVYDGSGNLVRTLLDNVSKTSGSTLSQTWDGRDSGGNFVPEGTYTAVISAVDNYGKPSAELSLSITGGYLPVISNFSLNPNIYIPDANNPATITYDISKDAIVTVQVLKSSTVYKTIYSNKLQAAGSYTVQWDGKDSSGTKLTDGSYTLKVTAASPTVPTFSNYISQNFSISGTPPSVSNGYFSSSLINLSSSSSVLIRYDLSESSTVSVDIYRGSDLIRNLVVNQIRAAGNALSNTWDLKDNSGNLIGEGVYTAVIRAVDASNMSAEGSASVTAAYKPTITNAIHSAEPYDPGSGNLTVNFDLSSDANVTAKIFKGPTLLRTLFSNTLMPKGASSISWDGKDSYGIQLADGSYSIQIDAVSPIVSSFTSTYKGTVTLDSGTPPAVSVLGLTPSIAKVGSSVTFSYTLSEAATVTSRIYRGEELIKEFPPESKISSGTYYFSWGTAGLQIPSGAYTLKIAAVDSSNLTGVAVREFQVGVVPVISSVYANPTVINMAKQENSKIYFEISERSTVSVVILDSARYTHAYAVMNTIFDAGPVTVTWNGKDGSGKPENGTFIYKITANSTIGNFAAAPVEGNLQVINADILPTPTTCTGCHIGYPGPHPTSNCYGCHGGDAPVQDCYACHGGPHGSNVVYADCAFCHNSTYSYKIPVHPENQDEYHVSQSVYQDCQVCHLTSLTKEHLENETTQKDVYGNFRPQTCNTCHTGTSTIFQSAVGNDQKNCDACHGKGSHNATHNTSLLDTKCQTCHRSNLSDEHLVNTITQTNQSTGQLKPWNCGTCHNGNSQTVAGAVYTGNMQCAACHRQAHNMNIVETVPSDIPLLEDFTWGLPVQASIWAGEPWMPDEFKLGGKVLISKRRTGVNVNSVWDFYKTQLQAGGWVLTSPAPASGANYFNVTFTKGERKAILWFYGGKGHTASPVLPQGYRLEILYK